MWNKSSAPPNAPQTPASPATPSATAAARIAAVGAGAAETTIGPTMHVKGTLESTAAVDLYGEFEGQMDVRARLVVGPDAKAVANLKVAELLLAGTVQGNVDASERVSLKSGANLAGDVKTPGIVIEDGAYFKGGIDIIRGAPEKPNS